MQVMSMARKLNRRERRERMESDERVQENNRVLSELASQDKEADRYKHVHEDYTGIKFIDDILNLRQKKQLHEDMVRDGIEEPEPYVEPKYTRSRFACINAIMTWGLHLLLKLPRFTDPGWVISPEVIADFGRDPHDHPEYKAHPIWHQASSLLYVFFVMVPFMLGPLYMFIKCHFIEKLEQLGIINNPFVILMAIPIAISLILIGISILNLVNKLFHLSFGYYASIFLFLIGAVIFGASMLVIAFIKFVTLII